MPAIAGVTMGGSAPNGVTIIAYHAAMSLSSWAAARVVVVASSPIAVTPMIARMAGSVWVEAKLLRSCTRAKGSRDGRYDGNTDFARGCASIEPVAAWAIPVERASLPLARHVRTSHR